MQGFNMGRYHAPGSLDPSLGGVLVPSKRSKPSNRADSAGRGAAAPTVRFEMPFAIWCSTCPEKSSSSLIGQGVRFNAQKRKVGNYYSTPIWAFRMKHTACGGWIEMRTNPAKSDFDVTDGARRRDLGKDEEIAERTGGIVLGSVGLGLEQAEKSKEREDAFAALEGKKESSLQLREDIARLAQLRSRQERDWKDTGERNALLRRQFRVGRKQRKLNEQIKEDVKDKMGLGIDLLDVDETDEKRAKLVEFGAVDEASLEVDGTGRDVLAERKAVSKPLFSTPRKTTRTDRSKRPDTKTKAQSLSTQLRDNTRAAADAFAVSGKRSTRQDGLLKGLKRQPAEMKDDELSAQSEANHIEATNASHNMDQNALGSLLEYESE